MMPQAHKQSAQEGLANNDGSARIRRNLDDDGPGAAEKEQTHVRPFLRIVEACGWFETPSVSPFPPVVAVI